MFHIILFLVLHFIICTLFFVVVQRPVFIAYNRRVGGGKIEKSDLRDIYRHGLRTDLKVASYLTAVPVLILWAFAHAPHFDVTRWIILYDEIISVVVALIVVADTVLYRSWQFKIEASVLHYLRTPQGAFASVSAAYVLAALLVVLRSNRHHCG